MVDLDTIRSILRTYIQERDRIEAQATREGVIPRELCQLCEEMGFETRQRRIVESSDSELKGLERFMEWLRENSIISFRTPTYNVVSFDATKPFGQKRPDSVTNGRYTYSYSSTFEKRAFSKPFRATLRRFEEIESCSHFRPDAGHPVHLMRRRRNLIDNALVESVDVLFLCCQDCEREIRKRGCDVRISRSGFIHHVQCDLKDLIMRKALKDAGVAFESGEKGRLVFHPSVEFYVRDHSVLITDRPDEATISRLSPKLLVMFGRKSAITSLLDLKVDILLVTGEGEFYYYDHNRTVEKSLDAVVRRIVEKLDIYADRNRGNEHDRIIQALEQIGQELGYIPEREHGGKGARIDCVWFDREGRIGVAIEVETKGGWKKDIISTWELEPELAVVVTYQKTDSIPATLVEFSLMKYLPHRLLYVNMERKSAYLFDKQQIVGRYSLVQAAGLAEPGIEKI